MAVGKRYKFQGSTFAVETGAGSPDTITAITAANPPVVTATAHGIAEADVVTIAAVVGMIELNGNKYVVDDPTANTFELAGTDASAYAAYVSGGTATVATFSPFCELTGANQQDGQADEIEVTSICSTAKEFEIGLSDSGSLQLDFNWAGNEVVQAALRAAKISGAITAFRITFPGTGGKVVMLGYVQATSFQGSVNGVWTASATIKLTGEIFVTAA
jgi:hypothetical protein